MPGPPGTPFCAAWSWMSHDAVVSACQTPDRSGLPSEVRGIAGGEPCAARRRGAEGYRKTNRVTGMRNAASFMRMAHRVSPRGSFLDGLRFGGSHLPSCGRQTGFRRLLLLFAHLVAAAATRLHTSLILWNVRTTRRPGALETDDYTASRSSRTPRPSPEPPMRISCAAILPRSSRRAP